MLLSDMYRIPWTKHDNPNGWIEVTTECQLDCPGCYRAESGDDIRDPVERMRRLKADVDALVAMRNIQTLSITTAVRNATIGGVKVREGQTIALDPDDGLVAVDTDQTKAVLAAVKSLPTGFELITIYYGEGTDLAATEVLAKSIGEAVAGVEVEVVHGGQPHYPFLISAE